MAPRWRDMCKAVDSDYSDRSLFDIGKGSVDTMRSAHSTTVGVALSSGGAAAVAQIGVLEALAQAGIHIDAVAGTSAGSIVGAVFAAGELDGFRDALVGFTRRRVFRLFNPIWGRGALFDFGPTLDFLQAFVPSEIEALGRPFAAVAIDMVTGEEVAIRRGSLGAALSASCAIPGLFPTRQIDGRWLGDGALANPVPVDVAAQLGAGFVIAVNVLVSDDEQALRFARECAPPPQTRLGKLWASLRPTAPVLAPWAPDPLAELSPVPFDRLRYFDAVAQAARLVQWRIAAMRLQRDRADVLINVPVGDTGLFSLHRAAELVDRGRRAAEASIPTILRALERRTSSAGRLRRGWERLRSAPLAQSPQTA